MIAATTLDLQDLVLLTLAATGTALATGLGALPVVALGPARAARLRPAMLGLTVVVMTVASVYGLLIPAFREGATAAVLGGVAAGAAFLAVARRLVRRHDPSLHGLRGAGTRRAVLVLGVLAVHSLPEGLAIGSAWASDIGGLSLFVVLAIALQNIPEGTAAAIPMADAGAPARDLVTGAILTSAPQPVGAIVAYLLVEQVTTLLPASFGFAAGAMLALVLTDLLPDLLRGAPAPRRLLRS